MKESHVIVLVLTIGSFIMASALILNGEIRIPIQFLLIGISIIGFLDFLFLNWEYRWLFVSKQPNPSTNDRRTD